MRYGVILTQMVLFLAKLRVNAKFYWTVKIVGSHTSVRLVRVTIVIISSDKVEKQNKSLTKGNINKSHWTSNSFHKKRTVRYYNTSSSFPVSVISISLDCQRFEICPVNGYEAIARTRCHVPRATTVLQRITTAYLNCNPPWNKVAGSRTEAGMKSVRRSTSGVRQTQSGGGKKASGSRLLFGREFAEHRVERCIGEGRNQRGTPP